MTEKAEESIRVHLLAASECLARCCPTSETVNAGWQRALGRHWQILLDVNRLIAEPSQRCLRERSRVAPSQFFWLSRISSARVLRDGCAPGFALGRARRQRHGCFCPLDR